MFCRRGPVSSVEERDPYKVKVTSSNLVPGKDCCLFFVMRLQLSKNRYYAKQEKQTRSQFKIVAKGYNGRAT